MVEDHRERDNAPAAHADDGVVASEFEQPARPVAAGARKNPLQGRNLGMPAPSADDGPFAVDRAAPTGSAALARAVGGRDPLAVARVLILADAVDAELAAAALRGAGINFTARFATTHSSFTRQLTEFAPDLVLASTALPAYGGRLALEEVCRCARTIPVIIVSGRVGEEEAVDLLKAGARDYVAIDRLARLGPAVLAALDWREECAAQREAEEALRASEMRYRRLFESARDGILILDAEKGKIVDVNPYMEQLLGYTREEFLGKSLWELGAFKDIPANISAFAELQVREYVRYDNLPLETKDGRAAEVEFVSNVYREDGQNVIQCNIRDITERKLLARSLFQSQKMEAFGVLAGGMAHNINNTLGIIVGNLDIVRPLLQAGTEIDQLVAGALEAAVSGGELTRQLLGFARRQTLQPERIDVNRIVSGTAKLLRSTIGEDVVVSLQLEVEAWPVRADPAQLEASLVNLANNARNAMPRGGRLRISTRNCRLDAEFAEAHAGVEPGDYVAIAVADDGSGIPAAISSRVFEPFFTTMEHGTGTGLGLSMVFGFAKQSGGLVDFESKEAAGATFRIFLPRLDETALVESRSQAARPTQGGGETVLVVEDNPAMRRVALREVRDLGYRALEADCAAAALELLAIEEVDLLFTDIMMPGGMTGLELARIATGRLPALKVVVTSGYSGAEFSGGDVRFLNKPYRKDDLARALRAALDLRLDDAVGGVSSGAARSGDGE